MKKILISTLVLLTLTSELTRAAGLINDMQSCQGLIDFVDNKLDTAPSKYNTEDIIKVRQGLYAYNQYIQSEIISPGLLQATGGDQNKADEYQKLIDAYKESLVKQLDARYPQNLIFTDHAVALDNCAQKAVPSGDDLEAVKQAIITMVKLAKVVPSSS